MSSDEEMEVGSDDEATLNQLCVTFIRDNPVLLEKSQVPEIKKAKQRSTFFVENSRNKLQEKIDNKQLLKRIANMKAAVKKITDAKQTGKSKMCCVRGSRVSAIC